MVSFKDKLCWVTGASSGIGEALALRLAREGARLVISSNQAAELDRVRAECLRHTTWCQAVEVDLSDPENARQVAERVVADFGPVHLLINNAGISQRSTVLDTPVDLLRRIMEIDFFSYVVLTKAVLPSMIAAGGGYVAATSSISGLFGFAQRSGYAAAKHAVQGFFETLRIEALPHNVAVTVAYPGRVATNISLHAVEANGREHGVMDPGQAGGISPDKCARRYLRAIKRRKANVLIGGGELAIVYIRRFFPRIFFRIVHKIKPT